MTVDTAGFRDAHHDLSEHAAELRLAAERFPALTTSEREETRGCILSFLRDRVEPHTKLDELLLYPEVAGGLETRSWPRR